MKQHLAVSAIGSDRTGMVHELTRVITDCGGNISESRMANLGSEFAMLLLVSGNWHALAKLETELKRLAESNSLSVHLRRTEPRSARTDMLPYSIDVVCLDQTGIVLLGLTCLVSVLTVIPGRATLLQAGVHLALLAAYLFLAISP